MSVVSPTVSSKLCGVNSQTSDSSQTSYIASTLCYVQGLGDKSLMITKSTEDLDRNKNSDERTFADKGVRLVAEGLSNFFLSTVSTLIVDFGKWLFVTLIVNFFSSANQPKKFANWPWAKRQVSYLIYFK